MFITQYFSTAKVLKQVSNAYNGLDQQIIPSQKKMLRGDIDDFIQVCNSGARRRGGSRARWSDMESRGNAFIDELKNAHDRLNAANRRLRKYHNVRS